MQTPYAPQFDMPSLYEKPLEFYMRLALECAWGYQGLTLPNPAVGALLLGEHGEILAIAAHERAGAPHAEVLALAHGYARLSGDRTILELDSSREMHDFLKARARTIFHKCTLFCTLEPCNHEGKTPPCALLISELGVGHVVIGVRDENPCASGGVERLRAAGISVATGVLAEKCEELLLPFYSLNKRGGFRFFKHAQRLNGTLDGGIISSEKSRMHVHALRDAVDLLVISGRSVRIDNPLLDSRLVGGRAPDVLVLTKQKELSGTLRLFSIKNRKVIVSDSLDEMMKYRYVMVEGGAGLFDALADRMDAFLCYIAPHMGRGSVSFCNDVSFRLLHESAISGDILAWFGANR